MTNDEATTYGDYEILTLGSWYLVEEVQVERGRLSPWGVSRGYDVR